jgi:small-conductance mechanosensitive channel
VLGNLIAGMQIAITQPIRLDDVLIVENEWGRVEEITATYVVIRIWDDRRLVVPLEYFIDKPFQNWTRQTSDLIGSAFFWVDYAMPIPPLREALRTICEAAPEWDKRVCVLQVTDCTERAMQLRALVSTQDAGSGWDLRCRVREELLAFMQANYPQYLPKTRNQLFEEPAAVRASPDPARTANMPHIADTGSAPAAVADGVATP